MTNYFTTKRPFIWGSIIFLVICQACLREKPTELYHKFPGNQWDRFNLLSFEIPVEKANGTWDIFLFAYFTCEYQYETLDFNMDLRTTAGEERINEYQMKVKSKEGKLLGEVKGDSCQLSITLKQQLKISKPGILKIEIENLIPRMATQGISGVGIRMVRSGEQE